ncbi:MAG TPA: hypothetical protein VFM15_10170 [Gammaproteobacteria bacterium]|nr:hypothetical protein [Gammaproteobacteria bacterium]
MVIPMYYGTFPALTGTSTAFEQALKTRHVKVQLKVMKPGQTLDF